MASGLSPIKIGMPVLPPIPYQGLKGQDFYQWVSKLYVELEIYFAKMKDQLVDNRGFLQVSSQTVDDGFTVIPSANYVDLRPWDGVSDITSDATVAVAVGVEGQALILSNTGGGNITIKHNAQTWLATLVDVVLPPQTAILLRWDPVSHIWTQVRTL